MKITIDVPNKVNPKLLCNVAALMDADGCSTESMLIRQIANAIEDQKPIEPGVYYVKTWTGSVGFYEFDGSTWFDGKDSFTFYRVTNKRSNFEVLEFIGKRGESS